MHVMKNPNSLRAADLKKIFAVFGHFYQISLGEEPVDCRSILELIAHDIMPDDPNKLANSQPDLLIVMMNPGSSRPLDRTYQPRLVTNWQEIAQTREWVATRPDNTQYQIMRIMLALGFKHGRVLNLSDLREPKSPVLFKKIATLDGVPGGGVHSIFCPERQDEFKKISGGDGGKKRPVLVGWGRSGALIPLAKQALERLDGFSIHGKAIDAENILFAHPSPMLQRMKEQWVNMILAQMAEIK